MSIQAIAEMITKFDYMEEVWNKIEPAIKALLVQKNIPLATALYNANYRLIEPDKLKVISDEEIKTAWQKAWDKNINSTRDERLKAIAQAQLAHTKKELKEAQGGK
jgi:hypothetical protein